ncbi:unnamed protein product, partial [Brassica oleracea]
FADSVIHGFTLVGRANHYMPSLKADSIVKVDCFELQARLQSGKFKWNYIPTTETASVMDSSLPRIALTMVSGKEKILLLKKDCDNPLLDFKTESEDRCWWEVNQGNTSEN